MKSGFHPRRQGDLGEAAAIEWLARIGACVSFPLLHSPDYDLIADLTGRLLRVQVKTSICTHGRTGYFAVQLATSGGNQSWSRVIKRFDPSRADYLFVLVADGRRWFIPASEIEGRHSISVGGTKYSEFQIGETEPLDHDVPTRSKLVDGRGGAGVGEPGQTVNLVPSLLSGFDSHPPHFSPPPGGVLHSGSEHSAVGRTKMSAHHQVAVPRAVAAASGIEPGDRFRVESAGPGRFVMTRIEEYMQGHGTERAIPETRSE
jgi:bifunctional DNA-binding transcriptional regulator/antitoxin component of YhaV-PrlF toxin-antitoxin module